MTIIITIISKPILNWRYFMEYCVFLTWFSPYKIRDLRVHILEIQCYTIVLNIVCVG